MSVVIKVVGLGGEFETAFDDQYLVEYDPSRPGVDPEGHLMLARVVTSPDRSKAREFETVKEAIDYYRQSHGVRPDGKPNRPLTAFTISVE